MADEDDIRDPELEALQREAFGLGGDDPPGDPEAEDGTEAPSEATIPAEPTDAEKLLRLSADFANYRRRAERDRAESDSRGAERAVLALLPVLDHLDLAISHAQGGTVGEAFLGGVTMIRDEFLRTLSGLGIERMAVEGLPFDPNVHEAIAIVPAPGVPEGTIIGVIREGYRAGTRVLRPARVTVAAPPSQE